MQIQTGVISFRSPTGEFIYDEPIYDDITVDEELEDNASESLVCSPLDAFVKYIANKINTERSAENA